MYSGLWVGVTTGCSLSVIWTRLGSLCAVCVGGSAPYPQEEQTKCRGAPRTQRTGGFPRLPGMSDSAQRHLSSVDSLSLSAILFLTQKRLWTGRRARCVHTRSVEKGGASTKKMDREVLRKASRTAFLKKEAERRSKVASAVMTEKLNEIKQGLVPATLTEANFLLQRSEEVRVADGLLKAARHRTELAGDSGFASTLRDGEAVIAMPEVTPATSIWAKSTPISTSTPTDKGDSAAGFVEMEADLIQARVAAHDYVEEKTYEDVQHEKVSVLRDKHNKLQEQRRSLPIYRVRDEFLKMIRDNQVVVVVGETGSGKTTQTLQYLYEEGLHLGEKQTGPNSCPQSSAQDGEEEETELQLICTQPRLIAAVSVAERVAQEVGSRCGSVVGYRVRFNDNTSPLTRILFATDGMMLKEFTRDPNLSGVAAIMVDEAHERSLNTDILLGLLRDVIRRNPRIKVIVASATIDSKRFSKFFNGAPVFTVTGRTFPVDVFYSEEPVADYITESAQTAIGIHISKPLPGDILIFLPGQDAIETCVETLREYVAAAEGQIRPLLILPIYSSLPPKEQARIYEPTPVGTRKVVIATNIAETSITIDGVVYVVDCGLCKQDYYNPRAMVEELRVVPTSQASATQRTGRAGRTQRGECFRLFTVYTFKNELPPETVPEIMRCSLSAAVLQLKALGVDNLLQFDFVDSPSTEALERSLDHLYFLGAIKPDGRLTVTGRRMAEFPMDPSLSKSLIRACSLGCGRHMAMAAAMLTMDSVFINSRDPREKQQIQSAKDQLFSFGNGDVVGYVRILEEWLRSGSRAGEFCATNCIHPRTLLRARDVYDQILRIYDRVGFDLKEDAPGEPASSDQLSTARIIDVEGITKALLSGFFFNVAKIEADKRTYTIVRPMHTGISSTPHHHLAHVKVEEESPNAEIHPSSYLFRSGMCPSANSKAAPNPLEGPPVLRERPPLVVFTQLRRTTKRFMMNVTSIPSVDMVLAVAPAHYFTREALETGLRKRTRDGAALTSL